MEQNKLAYYRCWAFGQWEYRTRQKSKLEDIFAALERRPRVWDQ